MCITDSLCSTPTLTQHGKSAILPYKTKIKEDKNNNNKKFSRADELQKPEQSRLLFDRHFLPAGLRQPCSALDVSMGWTPFHILAPLHVMIQMLTQTVNSPTGTPAFRPSPSHARRRPPSLHAAGGLRSSLECTAFRDHERTESSSPPRNSPDACSDVSDGLSSSLHFINFLLSDAQTANKMCFFFNSLKIPRWHSGTESACQCRGCRRWGFSLCVRKIPWRREWLPTPVFLPGESHGQGSLMETIHEVAESRTWLSTHLTEFFI